MTAPLHFFNLLCICAKKTFNLIQLCNEI